MYSDRNDLNHWLRKKKECDKQVERLTVDPISHKKYAKLFQKELERRIKENYPNADSVTRFQIYQNIRQKVHDLFGYNTPMMTKTEYKAAIELIDSIKI